MSDTSTQIVQQEPLLPNQSETKHRVHLSSFASDRWVNALTRLRTECNACNYIDVFHQYLYEDLQADRVFWEKHGAFIEHNPRGRGYWIWKPHIILHSLSLMADGDILVYADAGCSIKASGAARFKKYLEVLHTSPHGILSFSSEHPMHKWTKMDTVKALGGESIISMNGVIATSLIIRKCETSVRIMQQWMSLCEQYELLDDSPSVSANHSEFIEHKHDQSILSLLLRLQGCYVTLDNETWTYPDWDDQMPIWAARAR